MINNAQKWAHWIELITSIWKLRKKFIWYSHGNKKSSYDSWVTTLRQQETW